MATRLHRRQNRRTALILIAFVLALSGAAAAQETFVACWVEPEWDPVLRRDIHITVCRLTNEDITEYPEGEPPGVLHPAVGTDSNGQCWYRTSAETDWEILSTFSDGSAILGLYINGFLALDTDRIPRCTSEPVEEEPPSQVAWEAITEYVHDPPTPEVNPPVGLGLTGMETHVGVPVPGSWSDSISIPLYTIDVEVWVEALRVDWGDSSASDYPPEAYPDLTGYPDGLARHVYEVKTCDPPGRDYDCHPEHSAYPLSVSYVWGARWRANGGSWIAVNVPPSSTTVDYPVIEAVSTLTEVG